MAKKEVQKSTWTPEQDARLRKALEDAQGTQSWSAIARTAFPDGEYNKADCTERWRILGKPKALRGPWTKEEDAKLQSLVDQHGSEKWVLISADMGSRTGKQCRERWHNHLDPKINKGEWTPEEEELIHSMYRKIGSRWAEMAKHLPGRPDNAIKNFYNASVIREKRKRGGSISSMAGALDLGADDTPPAQPMSRSASSHSLSGSISGASRFGPYARSSSMTKSRSESIGSLAAFSPLRGSSVEQFPSSAATSPTMNPSPHRPAAMMRSHSSLSTFSPPMPKVRQGKASGLPISRDLSDAMPEPTQGHSNGFRVRDASAMPHRNGETPPATPNRPPFRHSHSTSVPSVPLGGYAYDPPPPSPPMSATVSGNAFYTGSAQHPEFDSGPTWSDDHDMDTYAEDYEETLAHLRLTDAQVQQPTFAQDQYAQAPREPEYTYPEQQIYSPPLSGHSQSGSDSLYRSHGYSGQHSLGHSASMEAMQASAMYGGGSPMPYVHPSHLVSMEQEHPQFDYGSQSVDEWGNVINSNGPALSQSYSSRSLSQASPIDAVSPHSDIYGHGTRSANSSAASSPYNPYSPGVEDVPEEPVRKPTLPRRGSMPSYPAFAPAPSSSSSSIYAASQGPHQPAYVSLSAGTISHSHSTPAALSSIPASPTPTSTKLSKPPLSSSASYHSSMRRISRPSSLSLSTTLEPPIDLSTPLASPSLYRPSLDQQQDTPRANSSSSGRATAASMSRGYSSPGGESLGQGAFGFGSGGHGLRIKTDGRGSFGGGTGMARSATVGGGLGSAGMMPSPSWAGSRSSNSSGIHGGRSSISNSFSGGAVKAHPTSDLMGVDQHGRACLPGLV